jgi:hypothetical protein
LLSYVEVKEQVKRDREILERENKSHEGEEIP